MRYEIGGTKVREGFYWGMKTWDVQVIERGGGKLPGDEGRRYVRIPALAMLLLGPILVARFHWAHPTGHKFRLVVHYVRLVPEVR